jgi:hypothetical protein
MIMKDSIMRILTRQDERGQSISLFVLVILGALIITAGLVIDGGQKVAATSRAESAAAGAAALLAMRRPRNSWEVQTRPAPPCWLRRHTLLVSRAWRAQVSISNGVVLVTTSAHEPTILLSIIGIGSVAGQGTARANIVPTGDSR